MLLHFNNFKSFENEFLEIDNLCIVIGSNASGKTNLIEGVKYISSMNSARDISEDNIFKDVRGSREDAFKFGTDKFSVRFLTRQEVYGEYEEYEGYTINVVAHEFKAPKNYSSLAYFLQGPKDQLIFYSGVTTGDISESIEDLRDMYSYEEIRLGDIEQAGVLKRCDQPLSGPLRKVFFLEPNPSKMRKYVPIKKRPKLHLDGENVSAVLYDLFEKDEKIKIEMLEIIKSLPENEILDLGILKTDLDDVMLILKENINNEEKKISARLLSDGTLGCISILAALYSVEEGSLIVIEEFDNGIHPNRARTLLKKISKIASKRNIKLLITTHNSAVLNFLDKAMLKEVNICYRDFNGSSKISKLTDIDNYWKLISEGKLGDLLAKDRIVEYIKAPKVESYTLSWLED